MQRIDVLIAAALVVAAAASVLGVMTYEDDRLATFTITWTVGSDELELPPLAHTGAGPVEGTFDVTRANLTAIDFSFVVGGSAPRLQPTPVIVEVVSPTNVTTSVEGELPIGAAASIELPLEVPLAPVPDTPSITAPSAEAAARALNATVSSSLGMGSWTIRASFAPGAPGPLGGQETHTVEGTATLRFYEATLGLVGPGVGR